MELYRKHVDMERCLFVFLIDFPFLIEFQLRCRFMRSNKSFKMAQSISRHPFQSSDIEFEFNVSTIS